MKSIKHSKIKNTGLIFELLVRQIASDTLNNKESLNIINKTTIIQDSIVTANYVDIQRQNDFILIQLENNIIKLKEIENKLDSLNLFKK